jgi:hypothetical protein
VPKEVRGQGGAAKEVAQAKEVAKEVAKEAKECRQGGATLMANLEALGGARAARGRREGGRICWRWG